MNRLSARERRLVAIGLLVAALALVWLAIVGPILAGFDNRRLEREALTETYARGERVIATMRTTRAEARAQRRTAPAYSIAAATPALASEALRERIVAAARAAGGAVSVAQEVQAVPGQVRVRADLQLGVDQLERMLRALQDRPPWLVVETLAIVSDRAQLSQRADLMDVRLEASALHAAQPSAAPFPSSPPSAPLP